MAFSFLSARVLLRAAMVRRARVERRPLLLALAATARAWARVVALVAGLVVFAWVANRHYPIRHWLFLVYLRAWGLGLLFLIASLAVGRRVGRALLPERGPLGESLAIDLGLGVLVFGWGVFVGGLLGWLRAPFFYLWPAALLAAGGPGLLAEARRLGRRLRPFGARLLQPRGAVEALAAVAGALGLCAVYATVIAPGNQGADAHWYHLPLAEHYVAAGRIAPFPEGWYLGAFPQLASILYTWAFLGPGSLFDHVALAGHLELLLFLATLASVAPLARRLLGGRPRVPLAGVAMLAFPGLYLYDSSLVTQADHVLAFWAAPLALALLRLHRWFTAREAITVGLLAAGAALTKYQASYLVAPAALAVGFWALRRRRVGPLLAVAAAGLAGSSAHWLKNLVFYGDPLYPLLHTVFPAHPFYPGAAAALSGNFVPTLFTLQGTPAQKAADTLTTLATFSFVPNDWIPFHGTRPVFGSLFTLLLPALALVRARPRVWMLAAAVHLGVAIWYVTNHQDRYLQALLPWMAACTATTLVLLWQERGWALRAAIVALVGFQIVWGGDVYFIRTHAMLGDSPVKRAVDQIAAGQEGRYADRLRIWGGLQDVGAQLPPGAVVIVHELTEKLGLGARAVVDQPGWQGGIDYRATASPRDTLALWRRLGVTHVLWREEHFALPPEALAGLAVFTRTLELATAETTSVGGYTVTRLQAAGADAAATSASAPVRLAWVGCGGDPEPGIYTPAGLGDHRVERALSATDLASHPGETLRQAMGPDAAAPGAVRFLAVRSACAEAQAALRELGAEVRRVVNAGDVALWARNP